MRSSSFNIKQKLTLWFVVVFVIIWIISSITIYIFSEKFRKEEFYRRLEEKAITAARLLIEVDEVDANLLKRIDALNPIRLPNERIGIFDYLNEEVFSTDSLEYISVTDELLNAIRLNEELKWNQGKIEVLGLLYTDKYDRFVVITSAQDTYGYRKLNNLIQILILVFLFSLIIISLAAWIYSVKALQPISEVVQEVNRIEAFNLHQRLDEGKARDEISSLRITFNKMLSRLQASFESQKSFIANASHELRTPMTSILSQVDIALLKDRSVPRYEKILKSVRQDVNELASLTEKLLILARAESFKERLEIFRLDTAIWSAVTEISKKFSNPIRVIMDESIDDENYISVNGSEQLTRHAIGNILENACKYSNNQEVTITIKVDNHYIHISVADKGIGIPKSDIERLGQPFHRGLNAGDFQGSGIGLNLVSKVMQLHKGHLVIDSNQEIGTNVTLSFFHQKN